MEEEATGYLIPDKVYDVLKWVGLIALPALAVCVQTIGTAADWTGTDLTVTILTALGTLVGALIGASAIKARQVTQEWPASRHHSAPLHPHTLRGSGALFAFPERLRVGVSSGRLCPLRAHILPTFFGKPE